MIKSKKLVKSIKKQKAWNIQAFVFIDGGGRMGGIDSPG
jgi:hypothetical protein